MTEPKTSKRKLIEVALPLDAINRESAHEKSIRHGHPSTLHLWWARRPLAACRAVLFASLVDDPSSHPDKFPTEEAQDIERQRIFRLLEDLVKWEKSNDEEVLTAARREIMASTGGKPPPAYDLFCGGGSIPLEAQRLGLEASGSDLNPVAVLISKSLTEVPARFADSSPVHPKAAVGRLIKGGWKGATGLAADVRHYAEWMRGEAEKRIGHLYPKVKVPKEDGGGSATVIVWLWARTMTCPNPACGAAMPLVRSFALSTKKGKLVHVEPVVSGRTYRFEIRTTGKAQPGTVSRRGARCICCDSPVPFDYVRGEGKAGRIHARLMAIVADGESGRLYLPPAEDHARAASIEKPRDVIDIEMPHNPFSVRPPLYGFRSFCDIFSPRQLVALKTFTDLVGEARERVLCDVRNGSFADDERSLEDGGRGARAYADAVATYLAFGISKLADRGSSIASWDPNPGGYAPKIRCTFARQAVPMTWDYTEGNPFGESSGNWHDAVSWSIKVLERAVPGPAAAIRQADATTVQIRSGNRHFLVSTDPPYYDNIAYADLSDFFYVWLRLALKGVYPALMRTMQVPKEAELVATPYRFDGDKGRARSFFEGGLGKAFERVREAQDPDYPFTVFYAFKQSETEDGDDDEQGDGGGGLHASTGWETMLEGLISAGFSIVGTWPIRTELATRSMGLRMNALASSIVLVCRPRSAEAPVMTRSDFLKALKRELPAALNDLQRGNIAPVDLAQSAIGPGMAVFSRHQKVLDTKGEPVRVWEALSLINQVLDEVLAEQEGDFDADTRWALGWFEQVGFEEGKFGEAETLSKAKNTSVSGLVTAGILHSKAGRVRLLRPEELPVDWNPATDTRLTVWEATHHMIRVLTTGGEAAAADLARRLGGHAETSRELAYRLYSLCERRKRAQEALAYNALVQSWPEIVRLSQGEGSSRADQAPLFEGAPDSARPAKASARKSPKVPR